MTDNKNRSASDIRIATNKRGGTIATPGAVSYNFDKKGIITVPKEAITEDDLFLAATEAGAEDFEAHEDTYVITTPPDQLFEVQEALDKLNITSDAELDMIPKTTVDCDEETQASNQALIDWLEDLEDVDAVYHNMS